MATVSSSTQGPLPLFIATSVAIAGAAACLCALRSATKKEADAKHDDPQSVTVTLPEWVTHADYFSRSYKSDEDMMSLAVHLSAKNVAEESGGPFGSAIFKRNLQTGHVELFSVGMNRVVPLCNSMLHGETVAIQLAQRKLGNYSLNSDDEFEYELFTSCEPCAMCLGATLWSGVSRIVCGARKSDAAAIGFDEGPVYEKSYEHLVSAGIEVKRGVLQKEAANVLQEYGKNGVIYNGL